MGREEAGAAQVTDIPDSILILALVLLPLPIERRKEAERAAGTGYVVSE